MSDPIRSEFKRIIATTPWENLPRDLGGSEVRHVLSDTGAIESFILQELRPLHCGCIAEPGGCCSGTGCSQIVCLQCLKRCVCCGAALGPCCSNVTEDSDGLKIVLCDECHGNTKRKQIGKKILRTLLCPFFRFHDEQ